MANREISLKFRDREIENPTLRVFVLIFVVIAAPIIVVFGILGVALFLCLCPIWLPTHFILKKCGRRGIYRKGNGRLEICFDHEAFRKEQK